MKKIALPSMIILLIMFIGFKPARAMDFTIDFGSISTLGDIGYGLAGGASFDFGHSKYKIDNYDVLSEHEKAQALNDAADQWLSDYAALRVPTMYMTSDYRKMVETANQNYWLANGDVAKEREALRLGLRPQTFSSWARYNDYWIKNYVDSLTVEADPDIPVPAPDPDYEFYIDQINGSGFDWISSKSPFMFGNGNYSPDIESMSDVSWFTSGSGNANVANWGSYFCSDIATIYINSIDSNTYTYSLTPNLRKIFLRANGSYNTYANYGQWMQNTYFANQYGDTTGPNLSYTGTLIQCLSQLYRNAHNINLYVDGVPWSLVDAPDIPDPVEPSFNDVVVTPDGDLAYDIVVPTTNDGGFDLTALFDAIKEAIAEASSQDATTTGDGILDISDVIAVDGIIDIVSGAVVGTRSIPFVDTIPDEIADTIPGLPVFPVMPGPIHDAFSGTTVLSELIDATQTVLPNEVTIALWGIVFILFIIGLIKIFHK